MQLSNKSIEAIFWDWDGTLCLQQYFWPQSRQHSDEVKKLNVIWADDKATDWMRGTYSLEQLREECGCSLSYDELVQILIREWPDETTINKPFFSFVAALFPDATHYIVTDNMDIFNDYASKSTFLRRYITGIFNSCDYRCLKPDTPSLFDAAITKLALDVREILLIDDSKDSCDAFENHGGNAIHIDRNKRM